MRIKLYKIRTYAQLDTWSRGTKQSQTKPIFPDLPLPAKHRTTSFLTRLYVTTPQSQKQSQTNPISTPGAKKLLEDLKHKYKKLGPPRTEAARMLTRYISTNQGQMRYKGLRTKRYDTASDAAEPPRTNAGRRLLNSSAALVPRLCRLNSNSDKTAVQNHRPHDKSTYNRDAHPPEDCTRSKS